MTNAFDSPSVIRFSKDAKDSSNPFSSPSVRVNGGGTTSTFMLCCRTYMSSMCCMSTSTFMSPYLFNEYLHVFALRYAYLFCEHSLIASFLFHFAFS